MLVRVIIMADRVDSLDLEALGQLAQVVLTSGL